LEKFKGKSKLFFAEAKSQWSCQNDLEQNGFKNVINGGTWQNVHEAIAK
jgi:hypothetical protein